MTNHSFDTEIARLYGIEEAILFYHIVYWYRHNEANKTNYYDGRYWTYNSANAFSSIFTYMSSKKISRVLQSLQSHGLILTANYNERKYDRTLWYSLSDKGLSLCQMDISFSGDALDKNVKSVRQKCPMPETKMSNVLDKNVSPIPDINTDINTNILPDDKSQAENNLKIDILGENEQKISKITKKTEKKQKKEKTDGSLIFEAYKEAYMQRYENPPIRDAKANALCKKIADSVGVEAGIKVARFYLTHSHNWYVQKCHPLALLLTDLQALMTQMHNGERITSKRAREIESTGENLSQCERLIKQMGLENV